MVRCQIVAATLVTGLVAGQALAQTASPTPSAPAGAPAVAPANAPETHPAPAPTAQSEKSLGLSDPTKSATQSNQEATDRPAQSPKGPAQSTWTTYLYQGPGPHYRVIEELPQATHFDVLGCANKWCEIDYEHQRGYVEQDIVADGNPASPAKGVFAQPVAAVVAVQPKRPCFMADQKGGNGGNAMTIFCEKNK